MKNEKIVLELLRIKNDLVEKSGAIAQLFDTDCIQFLDPTIEDIINIIYDLLKEDYVELPEEMVDDVAFVLHEDYFPENTLNLILKRHNLT